MKTINEKILRQRLNFADLIKCERLEKLKTKGTLTLNREAVEEMTKKLMQIEDERNRKKFELERSEIKKLERYVREQFLSTWGELEDGMGKVHGYDVVRRYAEPLIYRIMRQNAEIKEIKVNEKVIGMNCSFPWLGVSIIPKVRKGGEIIGLEIAPYEMTNPVFEKLGLLIVEYVGHDVEKITIKQGGELIERSRNEIQEDLSKG